MAKRQEFQGCLFDILDEVIFERGCVIRGTYSEAMEDAKVLIALWNADEENADRRLADEADCYVLSDGRLVYSEAEAV